MPPNPLQFTLYITLPVNIGVINVPPVAVDAKGVTQEVAPDELQEIELVPPDPTDDGFAEMLTVGIIVVPDHILDRGRYT